MTNKKLILILISVSATVLLAWTISSKWNEWEIGTKFVATFFIAIGLGLFVVLVLLPSLADKIGAFFFSAPEQIKPDPLIKAAAKVSQGDYEGAIKAYRAIASEEPENRFPVFEIAKIQQEYLNDVDAAIETFEDSLENTDWAENDAAAILFRLQQIYLESKQDEEHATALLQTVIDRFPETRHSANAHHRLNEINKIG
jgi:tetratricopeptide (TPR) repeat protein|tara:strand:+ start:818 stop:1414 length:597 start_codon:yes stop_codon:yes gene_type:complete